MKEINYKHITVTELAHGTKKLIESLNKTTIAIVHKVNPGDKSTESVAVLIPYELFMQMSDMIKRSTDLMNESSKVIMDNMTLLGKVKVTAR